MLHNHNHPPGNRGYVISIITLSDVIAKKKKKNFNLLLSSKRILYRKLEIRTDTSDI